MQSLRIQLILTPLKRANALDALLRERRQSLAEIIARESTAEMVDLYPKHNHLRARHQVLTSI